MELKKILEMLEKSKSKPTQECTLGWKHKFVFVGHFNAVNASIYLYRCSYCDEVIKIEIKR